MKEEKERKDNAGQQPRNGVVTVNDDQNPTPAERDELIRNEPDTERIRSERQSVEEGKNPRM